MKQWCVGVLVTLWALAVPAVASANPVPVVIEKLPDSSEPSLAPWLLVVAGLAWSTAKILGGLWFLWRWR
jgi:hypothetical protein